MTTKLIILTLFLAVSCGKDVDISTKKLEYNSQLNSASSSATNASGSIKRGAVDSITTNGSTYKVSIYSSYSALEFIAARPLNSQFSVRYKGKVKNNEMVLEIVQ